CALAVGPLTFAGGALRWVPSPTSRYQLDLSSTPTSAQLHGSFGAMELDGFDTPASVVAKLHALSKHAVCYIDVGTWESWRPDAGSFPTSVLGKPDAGWPGERWLDVRQVKVLLPLMKARFERCVKKGFDAVDPDNVDGVENDTGFPLTVGEQLAYDRDIAALAHADGLAVALKSDAGEAAALEPSFDFVVEEQCVQYKECGSLAPFVRHAKAVYDIEYTTSLRFCTHLPAGVLGVAKHLSLDDWARWCP
ncbi:MAG TPA: endo alpha-1,4 polygalactosaminidase, partial [Acidimicrobiales bacterium]|nr:endo alpha-1,4 polygalactosaminidase [Acidimicrobiales bacterium]